MGIGGERGGAKKVTVEKSRGQNVEKGKEWRKGGGLEEK